MGCKALKYIEAYAIRLHLPDLSCSEGNGCDLTASMVNIYFIHKCKDILKRFLYIDTLQLFFYHLIPDFE